MVSALIVNALFVLISFMTFLNVIIKLSLSDTGNLISYIYIIN